MSDSYLTSSDMGLIQRLLVEFRESPLDRNQEDIRAKFLVDCFEDGITGERDLRRALLDRAAIANASQFPEPGLISMLYRLLAGHRDAAATGPRVHTNETDEIRRRIDNDTDGTRRRAHEVKQRHLMH